MTFLLPHGKIIPHYREFKKPISGDQKLNLAEISTVFNVDIFAKPPKKQELFSQLTFLLKAEQNCASVVQNTDREVNEILSVY